MDLLSSRRVVPTLDPEIITAARRFARDVVTPNAEHWEHLGQIPYIAFEQAAETGLCGLMVPAEFGGRGLDVQHMTAVTSTLAQACMSTAFSLVVHNNLAAHIATHGTPEQREQYLNDMIAGRRVGAFLLTEPTAGSDAQAIQTRAIRADGGWLLTGEKAWTSNGTFADILSVYAQTQDDAGAKGIAAFLVDANSKGMQRADAYRLMRGHALGTAGFSFRDCFVADSALFRPPGEAFKAAMLGIDIARINVAAMCCGMLQASLAVAIRYADRRHAFGQSTLSFQGLTWMLADVATVLEAARALTARAAECIDAGNEAGVAAAHAKKFATRVALDGIADCMQAMGAEGYKAEYPLARHLASAKMAQFLDGTTEIQNVVIGRALRSDYLETI